MQEGPLPHSVQDTVQTLDQTLGQHQVSFILIALFKSWPKSKSPDIEVVEKKFYYLNVSGPWIYLP